MSRGFLVIDKPGGMTSNDVVTKVKRATGIKKVGHAGTLDPMATGVLAVGLGPATRLIRFVHEQPKEYVTTAQFGVATDSLDADGAVLTREEMFFTPEELAAVATRFTGDILQVPPMVSALKHEGRRLYDLAREGKTVERAPRSVTVHELEILSVGPGPYPEVELRLVCSSGTYVRSLADDMAQALGGHAHLTALRRTRIGSMTADQALAVDDLDRWQDHLLEPGKALDDLPGVTVGPDAAEGVRHGMTLLGEPATSAPEGEVYRIHDEQGEMLAVYHRTGDRATPVVVMPR